MEEFFKYLPRDFDLYQEMGYVNELTIWGHIIPFLTVTFLIIFTYFKRESILNFKYEKAIRIILAILLVVGVLSYRVYVIYYGEFDIFYDLPFHISNISAFMLAYALIARNRKVAESFFTWAIIAGLAAMVYPDTLYVQFDHFLYYQLMGTHTILVYVPFYLMYVHRWKASNKTFIRSLLTLYGYAILTGFLNIIFDTNYALSNPNYPAEGTPLVWIASSTNGNIFMYLILSFIVAAIIFLFINSILVVCCKNIKVAPYEH